MEIYNHINYPYVHIIKMLKTEIEKIDFDLCAQPRQTLWEYYKSCSVKPTILCNGGFFNMKDGTTVFNYANEGFITNSCSLHKEGIGTACGHLVFGTLGQRDFLDFVSGYPVLVKYGKKADITCGNEINYNARRTALGYNKTFVYLIAVENPGLTFNVMQDIFMELKVDFAINLDGGGSTKVLYNGDSLTKNRTNRAVDNVVAFYLKPDLIYRVQLGAFRNKCHAENFLKQVRNIQNTDGIDYSNAYIKKVGKYYKIQVGAFRDKKNAVNIVNDLKMKHYDSFITTA